MGDKPLEHSTDQTLFREGQLTNCLLALLNAVDAAETPAALRDAIRTRLSDMAVDYAETDTDGQDFIKLVCHENACQAGCTLTPNAGRIDIVYTEETGHPVRMLSNCLFLS